MTRSVIECSCVVLGASKETAREAARGRTFERMESSSWGHGTRWSQGLETSQFSSTYSHSVCASVVAVSALITHNTVKYSSAYKSCSFDCVNEIDEWYVQDLPTATAVQCISSGDTFGDCVFVLEYLTCFKPLFNFAFPSDLTVGALIRSSCNRILLHLCSRNLHCGSNKRSK